MAVRSPRTLLAKLLLGTLIPTVLALAALGVMAYEVARRTLEDELGRRLGTAAAAAAAMVLPEQVRELGAGDASSLTYANVARRLRLARDRFGVRRVTLIAPDLTARGDTDGRLALGAEAYEFGADRTEIARAAAGQPAASPLFTGHDRLPYKRGYAAIRGGDAPGPGEVAGFAVVEGSADYFVALAAFRRWLVMGSGIALGGVLVVTILIARRITGPVVRLAGAAARIGRGDLAAAVPIETRDELGFLAATLDEMRAALHARDERLQMMLAGIAHEVRNPLGGVELYAGLLREALDGQPERLQEVARIERELGYLKAVVNEFLEYARRPALELGDVRLRPLLEEVRELAAERAPAAPEIAVEAGADVVVRADAGQLRRALLNLARNAVTAAAAGTAPPRVVLGAEVRGDRVRVEVRDSGRGVPADLRDKIFTPFFTTREKGTGLGLAFVRDIVRDHGAEIVVAAATEGGASFRFDLPGRAELAAPRERTSLGPV